MQKQLLVIVTVCLVLTGCMSSGPPDLSYGNCTNLCSGDWWKTASTADLKDEIRSGANVNARKKNGGTPLHYAARYGTTKHIKLLKSEDALLNARGGGGNTPLHYAAGRGSELDFYGGSRTAENIKVLIDAGADVNARNKFERTPLHHAVSTREDENIKVFVAAGANVNAQDEEGYTPLHEAALGNDFENVKLLLNAGANPNLRNNYSLIPLDYDPIPEVSNLLKSAGSETKPNAARIACVTSNLLLLGDLGCPDSY